MRGAVMSLTAAAGGFVVFLLSMPVVQGQKDWGVIYTSSSICASKGSTVDIGCTYQYPSVENPAAKVVVAKTMWFRVNSYETVGLRTDPEYSGRVQYICGNNDCTLRITDLRESDSAEYQFRFITNQPGGSYTGSPGVTLFVTGLQVQVIKPVHQGYSRSELKCQSRCHLPDETSYIWYKNGQKIQEGTSSYSGYTNPAESYSCALKGLEDFPSDSMCVHGQFCNRVTYLQKSICVLKGLSVDIMCMYNNYETITSKFWFSPERSRQWQSPSQPEDLNEDFQYADRVQVIETWRGHSTLRITDLRESDSAQYHFKFTTGNFEWRSSLPGTTLTVTDPDLQVVVRRSSYSSWVELKCHSSCHIPYYSSYIWYKNGQMIRDGTLYYSGYFHPADSYSCALKGREDFPSPSECVIDQSCNRVAYTDRSICASKGSSVDISSTYNSHQTIRSKFWFSPERSHQWQSPSQSEDLSEDSQYADRVQVLETERGRSTLRITYLRESDSAQYHFKFTAGSFEWNSILPGTTLTVTALQVQVTRIKVYQSYTEAELKCHSSCGSAGRLSYVWFKNGAKSKEESYFYKDQFYPGDVISCALKGHETYGSPSMYAPRVPSVSVSPGEIMEGSSVTLICSSDANPAANYTWYKRNGNPDLHPLSKEPQLVFRSIQSSDSGEYYCTVENELGRRTSEYISINVKYAPKTSSVSVSPSGEIVEGSSVNLTCSSDANPAANYTWYKENQTLYQGPEGIHHFTSISSEDRGIYHCKSENQHGQLGSKSVFIDVQYGPKLPSVSVSPSGEIVEGSSVNLTCSSDANPAANYTWYKEDEDSPKASGQNFTITDFRPEHSGNYYCEAQNRRGRHNSTLHLIVVAGAWKSTAAGTTTAVVLALILLSLFILFRKKWVSKQSLKPEERPDNRDQTQLDDRQDELHYASFQFSKNHTDPLYSNIGLTETLRHEEDEDEGVEYTSVKFTSCSTALRGQTSAGEDSDALYSTINKTCSAYQPGINIK